MSNNCLLKLKHINAIDEKNLFRLENVSFSICRGESVAVFQKDNNKIIKNTLLLDILSGESEQSFGTIRKYGVQNVLKNPTKLFNKKASGRKNLYSLCSFMGMDKAEVDVIADEVIKLAELELKIEKPLKTFSIEEKGCLSIATFLSCQSDILIIDQSFEPKNFNFIKNYSEQVNHFIDFGGAFLMTTEYVNLAKSICNRGIVLYNGKVVADAPVDKAAQFFDEIKQ